MAAEFSKVSNASFVLAVAAYLAAVPLHFASLNSRSERWGRLAVSWTALAALIHLVAIVFRALAAGRAPWGNMYEFTMCASFVTVSAYLFGALRFRVSRMAPIGGFVLAGVTIWMGVGWVLYADPGPLQPALRSNWLLFHVFLVMSGAGMLLLSSVVSALYLARAAWESRQGLHHASSGRLDDAVLDRVVEDQAGELSGAGTPSRVGSFAALPDGPGAQLARAAQAPARGILARLPDADTLDRLAYKIVVVAFPVWTLGVIFGAVWGEQAWGRYWAWDPKETWSFIVWMIFATYLHARATRGWRGKPAALLALVGGGAILFNTFAVNLWIAGLHSYAGV
jgi:cytochrome c-type biogenesis protein CcsB